MQTDDFFKIRQAIFRSTQLEKLKYLIVLSINKEPTNYLHFDETCHQSKKNK